MTSSNIGQRIYPLVVGAAAFVAVTGLLPTMTQVGWEDGSALWLVMWVALVTLATTSPAIIIRNRPTLSFAPTFEWMSLLVFGPGFAILVVAAAGLAAGMLRRLSPRDMLVGAAEQMLSIGAAGGILVMLGGRIEPGSLGLTDQAVPLASSAIVYLLSRRALDSIHTLLRQPKGSKYLLRDELQWKFLLDGLVLPLALALAMLPVGVATVVAFYVMLSLLVAQQTYRRAEDKIGTHLATVRALMATIDAFDPFTRGHSARISKHAVRMAKQLGVPENEWEEIEYGALLHDIGRTAIHLDVLQRPRSLEPDEKAILHSHPMVGYEIVKDLPFLREAAEIVYAHHERPDGTGYPRGLRGHQIPIGARIIMVAAAFDGMTQDRPYRKGLTAERAYEELRTHSGTQFFPEVVEAFITLHQRGELNAPMQGSPSWLEARSPESSPAALPSSETAPDSAAA